MTAVRDEPLGDSGKITAQAVTAQRCNSPAPLVVNGANYAGCQLGAGHDGMHRVDISWSR